MFNQKDTLTLEEAETVVGKSVNLKGNLKSEGEIKIGGNVEGEVKTPSGVVLLDGAKITGNVNCGSIVVSGTIEGNVKSKGLVEVTETGKLFGDLICTQLITHSGATINGNVHMEHKEQVQKTEKTEKEPVETKTEKAEENILA